MLWIILLISQCIFGFTITNFVLKSYVDLIIEFIIGIPFGFAFSTFIFYFLSSFFAISAFHIIIHVALLLSASFILIVFNGLKNFKSKFLSIQPNKTIIFFLIISFITSAFIVFPQYYFDLPKINKAFQYEFNEEFTLMNSFYVGCNSGFTNPFKIRHPFCYKCLTKSHWLTALHSAMFLTAYSSEKVAIAIPSFLLFFQFCFIYLYFSRITILQNPIYSILSLYVFLFAGGFGFIRWFWRDPRRDQSNDFVFKWSSDKQTFWSHPIFQYLLAYRPSFMSLSLIINISFLLYKVIYINGKNGNEKTIIKNDLLNPTDYAFNLIGNSMVSIYTGILYGLTIPTQIEVTISFSVFLLIFFGQLFLTKGKFDHHLVSFLSFVIGFFSIFLPQIFILLRFRNCDNPIFIFEKFWQPLTASGRFYGEIVIWIESLGVFAVMTIFVSWIHLIYIAFLSSSQPQKLKDSAIYALKFYLPPFMSFLFINRVQFHGEARQDIIAFYPCWMVFSSMMFIFLFDSIVRSVKPAVRAVSNSKKNDISSSDEIESDDQNELKNKIESDLIVNVHLRHLGNGKCEESRLEEIQGILIGWFIFFFVITVASSMIGFDRLRFKQTYVYSDVDKKLAGWIISNTKIKDLFYVDPALSYTEYWPVTSLAGRVIVQDSSLCSSYRPNLFISYDKSPQLKFSQKLTRAGFIQEKSYQNDVASLAKNLTSNTLIPKLKYVINNKNSNSNFIFPKEIPDNWKIVYDNNNVVVYERSKAHKK